MPTKDPRVDAYIAKAAPFAQPILKHLRKVIHQGCPEIQETIKWGMPSFEHHGLLCGIAGFKHHCALGFWKERKIKAQIPPAEEKAMGQFGRIESLGDLPSDAKLIRLVREAARLNEEKASAPRAPSVPRVRQPAPRAPAYFLAALRKHPKALAAYRAFSPSHQREYVTWIADAKGEDTRARRLANAVAWIAEGKPQNWKYMKK